MFQRKSGRKLPKRSLPDGEKMPTKADLKRLQQMCAPKKHRWNQKFDLSIICRNCGEPGLKWTWSETLKRHVLGKDGQVHQCKVAPLEM